MFHIFIVFKSYISSSRCFLSVFRVHNRTFSLISHGKCTLFMLLNMRRCDEIRVGSDIKAALADIAVVSVGSSVCVGVCVR